MSLGDTWLGQGDAARDEAQEEAQFRVMENQVEKNIENEMGATIWAFGLGVWGL